jgi:hypothetical protein
MDEVQMTETRVSMPALYPTRPDEDAVAWTNRVLSHSREHGVNRQCSINWHEECSDPRGEECMCLCHDEGVSVYSVEGHPEGDKQVVTRVEPGQVRMPPQPGEPDGTWAEWILAYSEADAEERAIKMQEAKNA